MDYLPPVAKYTTRFLWEAKRNLEYALESKKPKHVRQAFKVRLDAIYEELIKRGINMEETL